ncbi:hypothetical protein LCGC14_0808450 [marine sediment metagenome]|uniref:Uncharacterized protein n=1 Tax=marine sediment metagenome TaxID=412755 RepID=A0A0F9SUZ3_9ZZZZ
MRVYGATRGKHIPRSKARLTAELLLRLGGQSISRQDNLPIDAELLIQWGGTVTPALMGAYKRRVPFIILNSGYFDATRGRRFSISINGFHGISMYVDGLLDRPARAHPKIKPWRKDGEFVLILGQKPPIYEILGLQMEPWLRRTAQRAAEAFRRPALIRPHPFLPGLRQRSLQAVLEDGIYAAVTLSSNASVATTLAGVRTLALHPTCPAQAVSIGGWESVDDDPPSNREAWVQSLAQREFDEFARVELDKAAAFIEEVYPAAQEHANAGQIYVKGVK